MTKYTIKGVTNGYRILVTTEYKTHDIYITEELRLLREYYYLQKPKEKTRLCSAWKGSERLGAIEIINESDLTLRDTYVLCDLALSQAIVNMLDNAKGVTHYGL